jgi:deoxyribodipyrimidine photolyase-related protein
MDTVLYILPHQLYDDSILTKVSFTRIILWEHSDFFSKYKFNKKKLVLHRASMKKYAESLRSKWRVDYIEYKDHHTVLENAVMFDPINRMDGFEHVVKIESPNFLLSTTFLNRLYETKKTKTSIRFTTYFYKRAKAELGMLEKTKSTDTLNRENLKGVPYEEIGIPKNSVEDEHFIKEAIQYVEKEFPNNYGTCEGFHFPIDHLSAKKWLSHFLKYKFERFGSYQDAVLENTYMLYHSGLSSSINIGLIQPSYIIKQIKKLEDKVPVNSYEGFFRQLIWREYQRYCYLFLHDALFKKNRFSLKKRLPLTWYSGKTGVYPVDITIRKAFSTAYLHHIERLMIIGNFMLLNRIRKTDGFKWFMEFAIDSYEWVMYQNVYDMVWFSTGGSTTHKAYISSSNYIRKMSDFKNGSWVNIWDKKYQSFINDIYKNKS